MKFQRERWTPLTVVFEDKAEAEALHKVLARVDDNTEDRWLYDLFIRLGDNLGGDGKYIAAGEIEIKEA